MLLTLTADTAATYVELRSFQERLRSLNANVEKQEKSLELAEKRFANGIVTKLDVTQGQASLRRTRALAPILHRGIRQAGNRLCVLAGRPPVDLLQELDAEKLATQERSNKQRANKEPATKQRLIPEAPPQVVVGIPANLIRRRPDVRRAERRVAAQSEQIGVAVADLFPAFSINGSIGWQANNLGDLVTSPANAGLIRPGFNWNILNYHRIVNNIAVQDARFQQLSAEYAQAVLDANREVEDAIIDFQQSKARTTELAAAVDASLESLSLAQLHYDEGWIDFDRLNNLQVELIAQQDEAIAARADVTFALIRIYRALGGGWQPAQLQTATSQPPADFSQVDLPSPEDSNGVDAASIVAVSDEDLQPVTAHLPPVPATQDPTEDDR